MKRIIKYTGLSLIMLIAFVAGHAQQKLQMQLGYRIGMPVGDFKSFIGNTSFKGFNGAVMYPLNNQLSVGLGVSYNNFNQKYPRQVYNTGDGNISAVVTNAVEVTPVMAKATYSFLNSAMVRPYVGAGAGFNFISYSQYLGEFPENKSAFKPAVGADAGVNIPFGKTKSAGLNLGVDFNYLPFNYNDIKSLSNWGVHAGVFFPLR